MSDEIEMRASEEMPPNDAPIAVGEKGGVAAPGMPAAAGSSAAAGTPAAADVSAATEDAEAARTPEEIAQIHVYSKPLMSHSFAHALFNTAEGDDLATFADVVRTESRVYPRPVAASDFLNQPYLWSASKVAGLFERAMNDGAYALGPSCIGSAVSPCHKHNSRKPPLIMGAFSRPCAISRLSPIGAWGRVGGAW